MMFDFVSLKLAAAAAGDAGKKDLFSSIGIDWTTLGLQIVAFLLLLWLLSKFVYPPLVKMLDDRDKQIKDSVKHAQDAKAQAEKAEQHVADMVQKARLEAKDIVATARQEASLASEDAQAKAAKRTDVMISTAKEQIKKEVLSAKRQLQNETLDLVVRATGKITAETMTDQIDNRLIQDAIKQVEEK